MSTVITQDMPLERKLDLFIASAEEQDAELWRGIKARAKTNDLSSMDRVILRAVTAFAEPPESVKTYPSVYDVYRRLGFGPDEYSHIRGEQLQGIFAHDNWPLYSQFAKDIKNRIDGGQNITILGQPGSGKSNALAALLAFDVRNWPLETWQNHIWFCRGYEFAGYQASFYSRIENERLFIVDNLVDVGHKNTALVGVINTRTSKLLSTFITSQLTGKDIEDCFPGMLSLMRRGVVVRLKQDNDLRKVAKPAMPQ